MAAKSPAAVGTATAASVVADPLRTVPSINLAIGTLVGFKEGLRHQCFYFPDVDAADQWTSGIRGIVCLAWTPDDANSVRAVLASASLGSIILLGSAANAKGWLHVWSRS